MTIQTNSSPSPDDSGSVVLKSAEQIIRVNDRICEFRNPNETFSPTYIVEMSNAILPAISLVDVVPGLRPLFNSIVAFAIRWAGFLANGTDMIQGGWCSVGLSTQAAAIAHERTAALRPKPGRRFLRPIKDLREEFANHPMSDLWIAREYGWIDSSGEEPVWKGPFFRDGQLDARLVQSEERHPGSVIPAGWHPDDFRPGAVIEPMAEVEFRVLQAIREGVALGEDGSSQVTPKKASESELITMLNEGYTVEQAERQSGWSDVAIYDVAKKTGIRVLRRGEFIKPSVDPTRRESDAFWTKAVELSGLRNEAAVASANATGSVDPRSAEDSAVDSADDLEASPVAVAGVPNDVPTFPPAGIASGVDDRAKSALRLLLESNPEITTPEAVVSIRNQGLAPNALEVGRLLASLRKELTASGSVG